MAAIVSVNPATLERNGEVPAATAEDVGRAVSRARETQRAWQERPYKDRLSPLRSFNRALLKEKREVATLVTRETGKPLQEALAADVLPVLDAVRYLERHGEDVLSPKAYRLSNPLLKDRVSRIVHEPRGVVGIVAPWNYPFGIPGTQALYALFAGNAVVVKPASVTALTALKLKELLQTAGLPEGLLHVLPGPGRVVGDALVRADVDYLIFTGSVPVGKRVEQRAKERGIETCLELGGSDAAIVLADADLNVAANGVVWGRFTNAGQTCAAVKRVFVEASAADAFTRLVAEKTRKLKVGNGLDPGVDVGPLIDADAVKDMEVFVAEATARGAQVLTGGKRPAGLEGHFFEPTVLANCPPESRVLKEEVFGPVLPVVSVGSEAEAVRRANDSPFGLSASVWTRDRPRGERLAKALRVGTVTVNDCIYTYAANETPWGGVKDSGRGRTHGPWGLTEMTTVKHVNLAPPGRRLPQFWWFPYEDGGVDAWERGLEFLYGGAGAKVRTGAGVTREILTKRNL